MESIAGAVKAPLNENVDADSVGQAHAIKPKPRALLGLALRLLLSAVQCSLIRRSDSRCKQHVARARGVCLSFIVYIYTTGIFFSSKLCASSSLARVQSSWEQHVVVMYKRNTTRLHVGDSIQRPVHQFAGA
jgi:hypothetical protein